MVSANKHRDADSCRTAKPYLLTDINYDYSLQRSIIFVNQNIVGLRFTTIKFISGDYIMRYYFFCPNCQREEIVATIPKGTIPNIRDGYGVHINHYECPKCHNLDAGYMCMDRIKNLPDDEIKIYFQGVIGYYQGIRGFAKHDKTDIKD